MRPNTNYVILSLLLLFLLAYCGQETLLYEDPSLLIDDEFTFIPETPKAKQNVSMVYYGCNYNETSSVTIDKKDILVIKKFNGAMKWPCILEHDTISLGQLKKGTYNVTLNIIDTNPMLTDSLFSTETKKLVVGR